MDTQKRRIILTAFLFWLLLFLINFGYGAGWAGVYSILIKKIGSGGLSYFFLFSALGGFVLNLCLMFFADLLSNERLIQTSFAGFILVLGADLFVLGSQASFSPATFRGLLIFLAVLIISVPSVYIIQTWDMINKTFSPKSAANIYPVLSTAPLAGSILGGLAAHELPKYFPTEILIFSWGGCIVAAVVTTFVLNRLIRQKNAVRKEKISPRDMIDNFKGGFKHFRISSFALNLSIVFMSFWLVTTIIDFCYAKTLSQVYSTSEEMASFYGGYTSVANITALFIQTFLGARLLKKTGVRNGFMFLPLSQIVCFILMMCSPGLMPVVFTMFMQTLIGMSVQSNSVQMSFNVFAGAVRGKIRTLLEGVINPLGGVIASLMIIAVNAAEKNTGMPLGNILPFFGLFFSGVWLFSTWKIRRSYLKEVRSTHTHGDEQDKKNAREALGIEQRACGKLF